MRSPEAIAAFGLDVSHVHSSYRCGKCSRLQKSGSHMVYIPDGSTFEDSLDAIIDALRGSGGSTGWCLNCVDRLIPCKAKPAASSSTDCPLRSGTDLGLYL